MNEPLYHADSWIAVRRHLIDLTDYQALNRAFPITLTKTFSGHEQGDLYRLEVGEAAGLETLQAVLAKLPIRASYVIIAGSNDGKEFSNTLEWLRANSSSLLVATPILHVYRQ